jgi:hypothetical protein
MLKQLLLCILLSIQLCCDNAQPVESASSNTKITLDTIKQEKEEQHKYYTLYKFKTLPFYTDIDRKGNEFPSFFVNQKIDWAKLNIPVSNEKMWNVFDGLVGNEFFPSNQGTLSHSNLHVIDFNADGLLDVIYTGRHPGGGEIDNFAFFENDGKHCNLTLKLIGAIIEIERESAKSPIQFKVWEMPCCANQVNSIHHTTGHFYRLHDF